MKKIRISLNNHDSHSPIISLIKDGECIGAKVAKDNGEGNYAVEFSFESPLDTLFRFIRNSRTRAIVKTLLFMIIAFFIFVGLDIIADYLFGQINVWHILFVILPIIPFGWYYNKKLW